MTKPTLPDVVGDHRPYGEQICLRVVDADPDSDLCRKPATTHILWADGETSLGCTDHAGEARDQFELLDEHPFAGVCNMPHTLWLRSIPPLVGRCLWEVDAQTLAMDTAATTERTPA